LAPVLETFARGLPFAFRGRSANDGARVVVTVTGAVTLAWTLRGTGSGWSLWSGAVPDADAWISVPADVAWRVWTKGIRPEAAREQMDVQGDETAAEPLTRFGAIMA
ncbi:MAG: maleylpyruvate isomerase family mycothiol-dependent enzyme, partial [Candidatus Rokuibacteriota bacterium]